MSVDPFAPTMLIKKLLEASAAGRVVHAVFENHDASYTVQNPSVARGVLSFTMTNGRLLRIRVDDLIAVNVYDS